MTISGQFKDLHNNTIDVLIYKNGDLNVYNIYDYLDETHNICFDGKSPVVITRECTDLFEPIISSTCTIHLLSNIWCGDMLFSNGIGDIIVRIKRNNDVIFVGYVTPLTYSQDINKQHNTIEINCKDLLGCLADKTLSTGSTWDSMIASASYHTFQQVLQIIGLYSNVYTFVFPQETYNTRLYFDSSVASYKDLKLSDNLWLGESKDDEMSLSDILIEILKYTNSRIISVDGITHYMISNNKTETETSFYYANDNTTVTLSDTSDELPQEDKSNEQVTMDDCYNVIGVLCSLDTVDEVVISPLKKESLSSPYNNRQKYMTEYVCDCGDGEEFDKGNRYYINWMGMLQNDYPSQQPNITDYNPLWMRHWYVQYMTNDNWELYSEYTPSVDSNGNYIRQYECLGIMNDLYNLRATNPQDMTPGYISYDTPLNLYPSFVQFGHGANKITAINTEEGQVTMKPYLIIPCPETWMYKIYENGNLYDMNEEWAYNYINSQFAKYENTPMVKYKANKVVNFTPSDNSITNYIIIKGSVKLVPSCSFAVQTVPTMGYSYRGLSCPDSYQEWIYHRYVNPYTNNVQWQVEKAQGKDKDKQRWYFRTYWTKSNPNQGRQYVVHDPNEGDISRLSEQWRNRCAKEPDSPYYRDGILYGLDTDDMYSKQYGWGRTKIDNYNTTEITMKYVPLLMCRLRIGDKYLNELQYEGSEYPKFEWTTDSNAVFAISVKPHAPNNISDDPTDFLIGTEYEIINTITSDMNLDKEKGMAIPIHFADKLHGDIEFQIVGPYNAVLQSTNHYYKHATWFRSSKSWSEQNADVCLLNHIHSINISDFEIIAASNNAKNTTYNEGDLLYYSEDNKKYNNPKDDIEFKIVTALTAEEAHKFNVSTGISYNNPTLNNGDLYIAEDTPEEAYVQTMYDLYSTPKKIIEYETKLDDNNITDMYRTVYDCDLMEDLNINNFNSIIIGDEIDLKNDRIKIKTREI